MSTAQGICARTKWGWRRDSNPQPPVYKVSRSATEGTSTVGHERRAVVGMSHDTGSQVRSSVSHAGRTAPSHQPLIGTFAQVTTLWDRRSRDLVNRGLRVRVPSPAQRRSCSGARLVRRTAPHPFDAKTDAEGSPGLSGFTHMPSLRMSAQGRVPTDAERRGLFDPRQSQLCRP